MSKSLRFVGEVWVNAVSRLHDVEGNYDRTYMYPGSVMSWEEFLSRYNSGRLWTEQEIDLEGSDFNVLGDQAQPRKNHPHGALVRPARGNVLDQPVTNGQVYIIGAGLWCLLEKEDPNYLGWAYLPESDGAVPYSRDEFENVVAELDSCPATVAALPAL